ncbi:coiled-coil domain-containing protein 115 [Synchiropus splendidus]|uniref:coiled-coil domain-containing protein 115 n=1 Tax=Synchiropus splendidus TaxID=270530 RepID=UPI00237EBC06|nr:coiled-coil domain-containing protein 115 [Synchiropus splendidus]
MEPSRPAGASLLVDQKLLLFMEQLESLEETRAALNALTEEGWFSMSKARYSMGNKRVSALQFASEMEPQVRVQLRTSEDGSTEFVTDRPLSKAGAAEVEDVGPKEGVRRRGKPTQQSSGPAEPGDEGHLKDTKLLHRKRDLSPGRDPLKWFGILVPPTLKQAQSSFKQVIELSAQMATLQASLLKTREELQNLLPSASPTLWD